MNNKLLNNIYNIKAQKIALFICVIITFLVFYHLNRLFPLYADDWPYSFIWESHERKVQPITSFGDILVSQYNHYNNWGGRSIVHIIAQTLLWIGSGWTDVLNALAYVFLLIIIYKISNKGRETNVFLFLFIMILMWLAHPMLLGVILWTTGSANYLWGTLIILLFIYPYYSYYKSDKKKDGKDNIPKAILFLLVGVIAGWTNENTSAALIFFMIVLFVLMKREQKKIPLWAILGLVGFIIGFIIMIKAPGNYVRRGLIYDVLKVNGLSTFEIMETRIPDMIRMFKRRIGLLSIIYLAFCFIYFKFIKSENSTHKRKTILISILFFLTSYVAFFAMFAAPIFPLRATFGIIILLLISIFILIASIPIKNKVLKVGNLVLIIALFTVFSIDFQKKYKYLDYMSDLWDERYLYIEEQKKEGNKDITFTNELIWNKRFEMGDFSTDSTDWMNQSFARYNGLNTVRVIKKNQ